MTGLCDLVDDTSDNHENSSTFPTTLSINNPSPPIDSPLAASKMANLGRLPPELKIAVVGFLFEQGCQGWLGSIDKDQDVIIDALAALSLTDRFFNLVAESKLYELGILRHPYLLCWATDVGYLNVMEKILCSSPSHAQAGIIRYRPQDTYKECRKDTESAKQRFDRHYRTSGEPFQQRANWLNEGDFGERQEYVAAYIRDIDEDEEDEEDDYDRFLIKKFEAEDFGVVRWDGSDLDHVDLLNERKAVYWFPVHIAARQGNLEALALLVEFGALLNISSKGFCVHASDPTNRACLHFPDWTHGFDPTVMFPAWTPYHIALCHGHQEMARYLLETCPHISERLLFDGDEITQPIPRFISAMKHSYPDVAEFCLENELDETEETHPDVFYGTLVWRAFWELENFEPALEMLLRHGADLEHDLGVGHTLLVEACFRGYYREALALIEAGADTETVLHEPGDNTTLEEAMQRLNHYSFNASKVLDICCIVEPSWVWDVPVNLPSCDAALAVVSHIIDSGVDNETKNSALLYACGFHRVEIIDFLLKLGGDLHDPDVFTFNSEALTKAASRSPEWGLQAWSKDLLQTFSIIISHEKITGRQFEGAVGVVEELLNRCATASKEEDVALRIADTILLLVAEGVVDVDHRIRDETLIAKAAGMRNCRLVRGLFDLGARDDLATLWRNALATETFWGESTNEFYQILTEIDSEGRILTDPYFIATAMSSWAWLVVDLMEPHLHLDKDWVNKMNDRSPVQSRRTQCQSNFDGWSLLHFAVRFNQLAICRRLVAMNAGIHISAKDGETPLSLALESWLSSDPIVTLLMAGKPQLDAQTAIKYRFIAEEKINKSDWVDAECILAVCPRGGLSDIRSPLLLHAVIRHFFSQRMMTKWALCHTITKWNLSEQVIRSGGDVNAVDGDGNTPLGYLLVLIITAVENDIYNDILDAWITRTLISLIMAGAKPSFRNRKGQSVLELLDDVRGQQNDQWLVSRTLRTSLLYHVMLYRQSIGM